MTLVNWPMLTRAPAKARLYEHEAYFREGLSDAEDIFGAQTSNILYQSALMVITPDGLAAGKMRVILNYLDDHDFAVVGVEPFQFNRLIIRELWRYQFTMASLDHLAVCDIILQNGPALLLMLRSVGDHMLPATVRLSSVKGKSDPAKRAPGTLRSVLNPPNRLCGMIHCSDEPADLVRELSLLTDRPIRYRLLASLRVGQIDSADQQVLDEILRRSAEVAVSLETAAALERITEAIRQGEDLRPSTTGKTALALSYLEQMQRNECIPWRAFIREIDRLEVKFDRWDLAVVGSSFIIEDEPGTSKIITSPDPDSWLG